MKGRYARYEKSWRQRQIDQGLCTRCTEKAVEGKTYCSTHLEYEHRRNKARWAKRKVA